MFQFRSHGIEYSLYIYREDFVEVLFVEFSESARPASYSSQVRSS
jgi:hypothetical protein